MSATETICLSPATRQPVGRSPLDGAADVHALVARARSAQPEWAATAVAERARAVQRLRDYIASHSEEIAEVIATNTGKTRTDAMIAEVVPSALAASFYAKRACRLLCDRRIEASTPLLTHKRTKVRRVPLGVVGIIAPRNYPFAIPFSDVVVGLLAGNAVVLKLPTESQLVGRVLERCFDRAGLPVGIFSYVNLPGPVAGRAMLDARVDKLFFTGARDAGRRLAALAAESLTPVSLRLGGNDSMLVAPDADLDRAVAGALWAGMQNCGQSAGGVERIYVHRDVHQPFVMRLAAKVQQLRVGPAEPSGDFEVDMGAMLSDEQVERVRGQIQDALDRGAVIYGESEAPAGLPGHFLPATLLTRVDHTMRVMREETFGPVVAVMEVESMDRAVALANDSDMALTSSVWSRDIREAERLARRIQAGVVMVNDHLMSHGLAEVPWGGSGASGWGRSHGDAAFEEMTEPQCIVHDWLPSLKRDLWWHPHDEALYEGLGGMLQWLYGRHPVRRVQGLARFAKLLPRVLDAD